MKNVTILVLTCISLLAIETAASEAEGNSATCIIRAGSNASEAINQYQTCLDSGHQAVTDIRTALGAASFRAEDFKTAITHFTEIIESTERPGRAHFNRGLTYLELGKERSALEDFIAANNLLPGYSPAHFYRGITLAKRRRYAEARDAFTTALNLSSGGTSLAPIYYEKAKAELASKDKTTAIESLGNAIASDPSYTQPYFERALVFQKEEQFQQAITDYNQYIERHPDSAEAYYNRGLIYQELRQDHLAIRDFDKALELNPGSVKARASKGMTFLLPVFPVLLILLLG